MKSDYANTKSKTWSNFMIIFNGEYELIEYLKEQDLTLYGVSLAPKGKFLKDGWEVGPYHVDGYLYEKETMSFPVGSRFQVNIGWSEKEACWKSIKRIREAIEC